MRSPHRPSLPSSRLYWLLASCFVMALAMSSSCAEGTGSSRGPSDGAGLTGSGSGVGGEGRTSAPPIMDTDVSSDRSTDIGSGGESVGEETFDLCESDEDCERATCIILDSRENVGVCTEICLNDADCE